MPLEMLFEGFAEGPRKSLKKLQVKLPKSIVQFTSTELFPSLRVIGLKEI